ncbi:hypothetical protein [Barrientosiimonas humi]|uniref:hypothetical protein n=1 Tax=Barrientosiimonas humi TaxID=999931 RepID=UPI00370D2819
MSTVDRAADPAALLRRLVTNASVEELEDLHAMTAPDVSRARPLGDPAAAPLPADEAAALVEHSGLPQERSQQLATTLASPAQVRATAAAARLATLATLLHQTLDVGAAARLVGRHRSTITRAIQQQRLHAVHTGHGLRIPSWQFVDGGFLPGLDQVVRAIPSEVHPSTVEALMRTSLDELDGLTPIAWLASGGAPDPVADQVTALSAW